MSDTCAFCANSIPVADMVTCYGSCDKSYHYKCVSMTKAHLNALRDVNNMHWFCDMCSISVNPCFSDQLKDEIMVFLQPFLDTVGRIEALVPDLKKLAMTTPSRQPHSRTPRLFAASDKPNSAKRRRNDYEPNVNQSGPTINNQGDNVPTKLGLMYSDSLIYGTGTPSGKLKGVAKPTAANHGPNQPSLSGPTKEIYVSKLDPLTSVDDMLNFLLDAKVIKDTAEIKCIKLVKADVDLEKLNWVSFKIIVPINLFDHIVNPNIWPPSVAIREFIDHPRPKPNVASLSIDNRNRKPQTPKSPISAIDTTHISESALTIAQQLDRLRDMTESLSGTSPKNGAPMDAVAS